ncbi:MAG: amphi-Trp domain-containing protein [Desulfovibrionaceae bacterium]|nr:amphi-Trp domain-containing protein [Desulfovibrionaceae bacterium]
MEKQKIGVKMNLPYAEAVSYLEDLLKSLKSGTVVVQSGDDHVTMKPGDNVTVEVEAKVKKGRQKFALEIEWAENGPGDLTITDKEPEPAPEPAEKPAAPVAQKPASPAPAKKAAPRKPAAKPKNKKPAAKKAPAGQKTKKS